MSEQELVRRARHRLAIIHYAEEISGNLAMTCRYYGISRHTSCYWNRRYLNFVIEGLRDRSKRPLASPNATHPDVVAKIMYLRQNYHFGPNKIRMYLKRYHDSARGV